jgi:5-formyltetrahydrofolate cyclo-ligase
MTGESRIPRAAAALPALDKDFSVDKAALRKALLARRAAIEPHQKLEWDARIGAQLLAWWAARQDAGLHVDSVLGVYWPLRGEPDLQETYAKLADAGVQLALPMVLEKHAPLAFASWTPGEAMVKDSMGVAVPADQRLLGLPSVIVVPCLGFNEGRFRLGYGGGYYDRTLAVTPRPTTIGVAYSAQQVAFDSDLHDIGLDLVLTETKP